MNLEVQKRVAENMKNLRKSFGYTQEELAERLHMHRTTYTAYESGKKVPSADLILDLTELYHVNADTILGFGEEISSFNLNAEALCDRQLSRLINIYRKLTPFSRGCLMERANVLLDDERTERTPEYNSTAL